jgi:hypothetical protein
VTIGGFAVAGGMAKAKSDAQTSANGVAQSITDYYHSLYGPNASPAGVCYGTPDPRFATACDALNKDNNNVNADATVANIALGVGIAGAVGLVISSVFTATSYGHSSSAKAIPFTVTPVIAKGLGGMGVGGTF